MIIDYVIDFQDLAKRLEETESDSFLACVCEMLNLVEFDNMRLVIDSEENLLRPIRTLAHNLLPRRGESELARKKVAILERFTKNASSLYRRIASSQTWDAIDAVRIGPNEQLANIEAYFLNRDKEKYRLRRTKRRTYGLSSSDLQELKRDIQCFCGEEKKFLIIDRYALGECLNEKLVNACDNVARWMKMLSSEGQRACEFEILAFNCGAGSSDLLLATQKNVNNSLKRSLSRIMPTHQPQTITFRLIPQDPKIPTKDSMFHDRFICSESRVMSIGKGLDVFKGDDKIQVFSIFYCGLRNNDQLVQGILKCQGDKWEIVL